MNRPTRITLIGMAGVLIAALWITFARADFDTGNSLYKYCTSADPFDQGVCYGLVSGYFDGFHSGYVCPGESAEITRRQLVDMVINDLQANPGARHKPATPLVLSTFAKAFGCRPIK